MSNSHSNLTVYFDEPFWVGVFEVIKGRKLFVSKVIFGAEPKDNEIYEFVLKKYYKLQYSPAVKTKLKDTPKNPKRIQREINKQMKEGIGTKSQQALKAQYEQSKAEHKAKAKQYKTEREEIQFALKRRKKKEKHKGH